LESDAHLCKYTYPLVRSDDAGSVEGFLRDDENGVLYVGEGGWGAELRTVDDDKEWTMAHGTFNQFKWLFIDQNNIEIRTVNTDNADAVTPKNDADSKFSMPNSIDIWNPSPSDTPTGVVSYNSGVLTLNNPTTLSLDLGNDLNVLEGTIVTLDAGAGYDSYTWSTGETSQTIDVSTEGNYTVTITKNGCSLTDEILVETYSTSVTQLDENKYQFSVSPNPAIGFISAKIISTENTEMRILLLDSAGKLLKEKNIQLSIGENRSDFSLDDIGNGIYLMVLEQNGATQVEKFVVSK